MSEQTNTEPAKAARRGKPVTPQSAVAGSPSSRDRLRAVLQLSRDASDTVLIGEAAAEIERLRREMNTPVERRNIGHARFA